MKRILTLLLLMVCSFSMYAQKKKVAILEPMVATGSIVEDSYLMMIGSRIETGIINNKDYESYNRNNVAQLMEEHHFQRSGLVNESEVRRLGQMAGVDYVLVTEVAAPDDGKIFVSAKVLNIENGRYEMSENELMEKTPSAINKGCEMLAKRLLANNEKTRMERYKAEESRKKEAEKAAKLKARESKPPSLFKPSLGFGVDAYGLTIAGLGLSVQTKLLKPSNKFNIVVGGRASVLSTLTENNDYNQAKDSTFYWKFRYYRLSPFITLRYGQDLYIGGGIRMNYNFGYEWYYGSLKGKHTSSSNSSYSSNSRSSSSDISVQQPESDGVLFPITWNLHLETGMTDDSFDLIFFFDWDITRTFSESTLTELSKLPKYSNLIPDSKMANQMRNNFYFGVALNIYLVK